MAQIMHVLEKKGYQNPAEEAVKVVTAYHDLVAKNGKNHYNKDYNEAFALIDNAIKKIANQIFYNLEAKSFDAAAKVPLAAVAVPADYKKWRNGGHGRPPEKQLTQSGRNISCPW
jgi:hypothetical protein